ncbi:hypothetical protein LTR37_018716 [Vermiconidia calcicola]|uniref:Uncharacterized protein n=1 Tax=Vermiconidia calcicola TaxID=1690605 RepID=A0ACC3MGI7_9PEZI|nr:hypothetical protein LTR37_018716 [Vermiconidia calcicola]
MESLVRLPPEILENILLRLERTDLKSFRCTSRECTGFATPLVFHEIPFDLDPGGCDGLTSIAHCSELRRHVNTIRLERRAGLKSFGDFDGWHAANIYEYVPLLHEDETDPDLQCLQTMSRNQWQVLSDDQLRHLYDEYENDERARESYVTRLASEVSLLVTPDNHTSTQARNHTTDAQHILRNLTTTIDALTNVCNLTYTPAFEDEDRWGRTWRNIEFHPEGLVAHGSFGIDPDVDALQLYFVLRTTLRAPNLLRSAELFTRGHAFWSPAHLRRLLDWSTRPSLHSYPHDETVSEGLESWTDEIGGPLQVMKYTESLTRELVALEHGFSRLSRLECRVDTVWSNGPEELETIASALSRMLKEGVKLEHLALIVRDHAGSDDHGMYTFFGDRFDRRTPSRESMLQSIKVSEHLLFAASALKYLRRLHLSFATGATHLLGLFSRLNHLRQLRLSYVALLPSGGQWEFILEWIAQHFRLDWLELRALEDVCDGRARLLLCPKAPVWTADNTSRDSYEEYEAAIVCFALGKSESLPSLLPEDFLRQKSLSRLSY